jgi:lipopolysaccharide transport system ATP-binding protein
LSSSITISIDHVSKAYHLFGRRSQFQTLKSALLRRELRPSPEASVSALRDVSFEIHRGEAFGIIGRNGSGKSTLLKIISGILKPTDGRVMVDGRISALIELGAGFHPEISGRENIYINGIMLGLTRREIDKRFDRIVDFSGIRDFIDEPVKTYSSGMYVRLGFAVAVHVDPDILIIDEVLAVGDEEFSQKCIATIQEMKYRGTTLLFVTHQLGLVRDLCDRALWLDHGAMAGLGDPVRVCDEYLQEIASGARRELPAVRAAAEPQKSEEPPEEGASPQEQVAPIVEQPPEPKAAERDPNEEERWGSGDVILSRVRLVDDRGREIVALGGSGAVTIEMDVTVREPQSDFVFGIGIFHADGTCVYGTNTDIESFVSKRLDGDGSVRFVMPSLELVAGAYRLDAAVHARNGRAFDYRRGVLRFVVGSRVHDVGVYRPAHQWEFEGGVELQRIEDARRNVPAAIAETLREIEREPEDDSPSDRRHRKSRSE